MAYFILFLLDFGKKKCKNQSFQFHLSGCYDSCIEIEYFDISLFVLTKVIYIYIYIRVSLRHIMSHQSKLLIQNQIIYILISSLYNITCDIQVKKKNIFLMKNHVIYE